DGSVAHRYRICTLAPSPGTPGEGWGEGIFSSKTEKKTLTLPSPGVPGEGRAAKCDSPGRSSEGIADHFTSDSIAPTVGAASSDGRFTSALLVPSPGNPGEG